MEWLKIPTSTELVRIRTDEIVAVYAQGNYCEIRLYDGRKKLVTMQLHLFDEAFQRLKHNYFVRIGRSLIINIRYVYLINIPERLCVLAGQPLVEELELRKLPPVALKSLKQYLEKNDSLADKVIWQEGDDDE